MTVSVSQAMADTFLYLETRGRKTGLPRTIEIWFVELAGRFYIVAEMRERAHWVKNLRADPNVAFSVGERADQARVVPRTPATARVLAASEEPELVARVRASMDAKYDWSDGLLVEITKIS